MNAGLRTFVHPFSHPSTETPPWASLVDRWYQLDPYGFGVADAYFVHRSELVLPSTILLGGPAGSNETDLQFVRGGTSSPSKFVHTLPSARASALCQVMRWTGPTVCVQKDPQTLVYCCAEAVSLGEPDAVTWIVSVSRTRPYLADERPATYLAHIFELTHLNSAAKSEKQFAYTVGKRTAPAPVSAIPDDRTFLNWLSGGENAIQLPYGFEVRRTVES